MAVTPDTTIHLLKVPLEIDEINQITFASSTAQYNYFISCPKKTEEDLYYQRKDNYISWPDHIDNILEYNYVMYQNSNYTNKWFYAFITNMEYENDGMTRVYIKTDPFQTWQFDITYKPSFVEREHVNDDTVGKNVIDEGLALGDFVCNKKNSLLHNSVDDDTTAVTDLAIVLGVSEILDSASWVSGKGVLANGIYTGLRYLAFKNDTADLTYGIPVLNSVIESYSRAAKLDAIYCIFYCPSYFVRSALQRDDHLVGGNSRVEIFTINHNNQLSNNKEMTLTQATLDGYTPINNKLLCYPYNYLTVSNNNGSDVIYRLEDFYTISEGTKTLINPKFIANFVLTPGGSLRLTPENYKGVNKNQIEGINGGKFPVSNWLGDVYTNWLTQNGVNIALDIIGGGLSMASQVANEQDVTTSGAMGIASTLAEVYKQSLVPDQARGNINCGDVVTAEGSNDFIFYNMSIKAQQAKIIDDYFTMYGYKVNTVKLPNITGRTNWNYVKTVNCNITGNIPQQDIQEIKNMFNNGVTLWHNPSTFLDYSQSNAIVT